jgi:purine-binding chemotaxis protein CheW
MQNADAGAIGENHVTLGCFEVGGHVYAIDVSQVREIVRWQEVTPLPNAPVLIEGVIDLRGAVVPIVDLGRALGGAPVTPGPRARIAVTEVDGLVMGLAVDAAVEVLSVDVAQLDDPPALATQTGYDMTRAVVRRPDDKPILVLSLEHVLEGVYRSALRVPGGAA